MIHAGIMWETPTAMVTPFSEQVYIDPVFEPWHEWFAWRPVKMVYWNHHADGFGKGIRVYKWVWMKKIVRRMVKDRVDGPGRESVWPQTRKYWEYTTLMDLLKHGH